MTLEHAKEKIAQAYQIIGVLLNEVDESVLCNSSPERTRVLDYFSDTEKFDAEFLPWPQP